MKLDFSHVTGQDAIKPVSFRKGMYYYQLVYITINYLTENKKIPKKH